jgi:hypothetical protein
MTPTSIPVANSAAISSDSAGFIGAFFAGSFFLIALAFLFWLLALVDILKSEFKDSNNKIIWLALTFLLPMLGPVLYFLIGRKQIKKGSGISLKVFFTIIMFFVWYPLAIVSMWFWTNWPRWAKIVVTIIGVLLFSFSMWGKYLSPYK